ncbi:hypothetical protein HIM_01439 [Hirsutella minnesotensis 3608]|nr:hypothetical protein HIM_01439 [Hirsutella minnesotensis 3608]
MTISTGTEGRRGKDTFSQLDIPLGSFILHNSSTPELTSTWPFVPDTRAFVDDNSLACRPFDSPSVSCTRDARLRFACLLSLLRAHSTARNHVLASLVGTGHIDKGALISAAGDSSWANSAGFELKPEEMKVISAIVSGDSSAKDKAFADGLFVCGERYVMARAEDRSIYARLGRCGIAIAKTKQAIIVGHHGEAQVAGNASSTVEGLADYLIGQGY